MLVPHRVLNYVRRAIRRIQLLPLINKDPVMAELMWGKS